MWVLLILLVNIWSPSSHADKAPAVCANRNFSDEFGPVKNSGGAYWCWANNGADYLGHLLGIKPPARISTMDVAISALGAKPADLQTVALELRSHDSSIENQLTAMESLLAGNQKNMDKCRIDCIMGNPASALLAYQTKNGYCLESEVAMGDPTQELYLQDYISSAAQPIEDADGKNCQPQSPAGSLESFKRLLNEKLIAQIGGDIDRKCHRRHAMGTIIPSLQRVRQDPQHSAAEVIGKALQANQPVMIGFNMGVLDGSSDGTGKWNHVATIVGSRSANGHCEYLLRDDNGPEVCTTYRPELQGKCNQGYVWLTEGEINRSTDTVYGARLVK